MSATSTQLTHPARRKTLRRQARDLAVIIVASAATAFTLYGCSTHQREPAVNDAATDRVTVNAVEAVAAPTPRYLTLTGTLNGNRTSEVAADIAGKVVGTMVERGQEVAKGEPLVRLDPRTAALNAEEAGASAAAAEANLSLARADCERATKLFDSNAISKAEFDRLSTTCSAQGKQAQAAIARSRLAGQQLGDATVRAPFAGMIAQRFIDEGEYVGRDTKIVSLVELDPLRLELNVPENDARHIRVGQPVRFDVTGFDGQTFSGTIKYVGPSLRADTRDLVVEAVIDNHDRVLRPGNFAVAKVTLGEVPTPVVPRAAIRDDGDTYRIFVVRDDGKRQQLEERLVQLGPELAGDLVAIAKGVEAGERVVATVSDDLRDGAQVTVARQASVLEIPSSSRLASGEVK